MSTPDKPSVLRRTGRHALKLSGWTLGLVFSATLLLGILLWAGLGRPIDAPGWLRDRVDARIDAALPGLDVEFSDLRFQLLSEGLLRIGLSNVTVRGTDGRPVAVLNEMRAGLSVPALLSRQLALREAQASGLFLTLERDRAGAFSLGLGLEPGGARPDLQQVLTDIDAALATPLLAGLDAVTLDAITLRYEDARAGRGWTADGGRITAVRAAGALKLTGDVALLGGSSGVATVAVSAESAIGETDLSFGVSLEGLASGDIATQSAALAWLDAIRAPISGDLRGYLDAAGALGGLDVSLAIGAGVLQPNAAARPVAFSGAQTAFSYTPASQSLRFDEIAVDSDVGRARASGQVVLQGVEEGRPASFLGQFALTDVSANPQNVFEAPLEIGRAEADMRLRLNPFTLELGRLRVVDEALPLRASGRISAGPAGWEVAVDAQLARTDTATVATYWPVVLAPGTRDWFRRNVGGGAVRDARLALRFDPERPRPERFIDLRFEDAEVRFARTLPPIASADGQLVIHDERLVVMLERGTATPPTGGPIDVSGSHFLIADASQKPATGEIRLEAASRVTALLSFLDQEPLYVMQRADRPVSLVEGDLTASGTIRLPLKPGLTLDDMEIDLTGEARAVESGLVVPERVLAAESLDLKVSETALEITGAATLSGVPAAGRFRLPFGAAAEEPVTVSARVTLSDAAARAFGVTLPAGFLSGAGPGQFDLTLPRGGTPQFSLVSDLDGLALALPSVGWRLAPGQTGAFEVSGRLGEEVAIDGLALSGAGLSAAGDVTLGPGGGFQRLTLGSVTLADWFRGAVTMTTRGGDRPPAVTVRSGRLDLSRANFGEGQGGVAGPPIPLSVALDTLVISEGIVLRDFSGEFRLAGGLNGSFETGLRGNDVRLEGTAVPRNGGTAVRLQAGDAGAVLSATGIFANLDDGALDVTLVPQPGREGTYDGRLNITEARLRDTPVLAAMLDAVSIVGILDQLQGPGIFFSEIEADFRLSPDRVILQRSSATGPSMGISMDGYVNLATKTLDLQGVFSPIYFINGVGQVLTRRGEGLFGFNFNIQGPTAEPRVAVNPLSVFTPGMFREIFRRPPPGAGN